MAGPGGGAREAAAVAGEVQREVAHCTAILVSVTLAARQEYWAARVLDH